MARTRANGILLRNQLVEVRTAAEIAATLDADGKCDGLPFMPEMLVHCGRRFRIFRRAEKTCVEGHGLRRMRDTVLLEGVHCDGSAHDGCQRRCLVFWKEAWLRPVEQLATPGADEVASAAPEAVGHLVTKAGERYVCQSTELRTATMDLSALDFGQYFREIRRRELTLGRFFRIALRVAIDRARRVVGLPALGALRGGGRGHSKGSLDLRTGEWVEVKAPEEIRKTLDRKGRNRGLSFEPDMIAYTGQCFEVVYSIERIISEETGRMVPLTNTVVLKGVTCEGLCAKNCPRNNPHYWREVWLMRIVAPYTEAGKPPPSTT